MIADPITNFEAIGDLTRLLHQLARTASPQAAQWASLRLDSLAAGTALTQADASLAAGLEEQVLGQRTIRLGARPAATLASEEDARALAAARAAARRAPSVYAGTK